MSLAATLDRLHYRVRKNNWLRYFAGFDRIVLALGFLPSGFVKVNGERFTDLANNHPMGHYLEALFHTGFYYPFIGVMQITAAVLLLIPRTATLGAFLYLPIILNIFVLSLAVRFEGSFFTAPLMVLANLYLLCWDYHKWKRILPFADSPDVPDLPPQEEHTFRFPFLFFGGVGTTVVAVVATYLFAYDILPRNSERDCLGQCPDNVRPAACVKFCACVHQQGRSLDQCLSRYVEPLPD